MLQSKLEEITKNIDLTELIAAIEKVQKLLTECKPKRDPCLGGFIDRYGRSVNAGDEVIYLVTGDRAILNEALQDGIAYIRYENGVHTEVKWMNLIKIP